MHPIDPSSKSSSMPEPTPTPPSTSPLQEAREAFFEEPGIQHSATPEQTDKAKKHAKEMQNLFLKISPKLNEEEPARLPKPKPSAPQNDLMTMTVKDLNEKLINRDKEVRNSEPMKTDHSNKSGSSRSLPEVRTSESTDRIFNREVKNKRSIWSSGIESSKLAMMSTYRTLKKAFKTF